MKTIVVAALLLLCGSGYARTQVSLNIGVGVPVYYERPVYCERPVYYNYPQPVYYEPVYCPPPPVRYVQRWYPAPVVVYMDRDHGYNRDNDRSHGYDHHNDDRSRGHGSRWH